MEDFNAIIAGLDAVDVESVKTELGTFERGDRVTHKRGGPVRNATVIEVISQGEEIVFLVWLDGMGPTPAANRHLRKIV